MSVKMNLRGVLPVRHGEIITKVIGVSNNFYFRRMCQLRAETRWPAYVKEQQFIYFSPPITDPLQLSFSTT